MTKKRPTEPEAVATPPIPEVSTNPPPADIVHDVEKNERLSYDPTAPNLYTGPTGILNPPMPLTVGGIAIVEQVVGMSVVNRYRIFQWHLTRWNPIRYLTPENLGRIMDLFKAGYLREFALMMDAVFNRDDIIPNVASKRFNAIKQRGYEIIKDPDADDATATRHAEYLRYFYKNMEVTEALDLNVKQGFPLLMEQMLGAIGFRYAAIEIIWHPSPNGLTAELKHVPTWFFENRTGKLRFLPYDFAIEGIDLNDHGWMVAVGQGIMEPCCVAYLFKHLCMKFWLSYCERHGMPASIGKTPAAIGSPQWNNMVQAVGAIATDFSCVLNKVDDIETLQLGAQGELPFPRLVERMDRTMSALWRGADLSTLSAGSAGTGQGASLQGDEADIMELGDGEFVNSTLEFGLDRKIIEYHEGPGTPLAAHCRVVVPKQQNIDQDIKQFNFIVQNGGQLKKSFVMERWSIPEPEDGDDCFQAPQKAQPGESGAPASEGDGQPGSEDWSLQRPRFMKPDELGDWSNERQPETMKLLQTSADRFKQASITTFKPVIDRLETIKGLNPQLISVALAKLKVDLPQLLRQMNQDPASGKVLEEAMTAGFFNGLTEKVVAMKK